MIRQLPGQPNITATVPMSGEDRTSQAVISTKALCHNS